MKSVLVRLNEYQLQMTPAESEVVQYILHHPEKAAELSVHELSARAFSSSATIVRMCRRLGFDGYKELRRSLQYELAVRKQSELEKRDEVSREDSLEQMVDKITYKNIVSLEETKNLVDLPVLQKCVDLLCVARNICLFGIGSSLCVARDAYLKFPTASGAQHAAGGRRAVYQLFRPDRGADQMRGGGEKIRRKDDSDHPVCRLGPFGLSRLQPVCGGQRITVPKRSHEQPDQPAQHDRYPVYRLREYGLRTFDGASLRDAH